MVPESKWEEQFGIHLGIDRIRLQIQSLPQSLPTTDWESSDRPHRW